MAWIALAVLLAMPAGAQAAGAAGKITIEVSGTVTYSGAPAQGQGAVDAFVGNALADLGAATTAGGAFSGLQISAPATAAGQPVSFTVDGIAATATLQACASGGGVVGQPVVLTAGGAVCTVALLLGGPLAGVAISGGSAATLTAPGTVTAGGAGTSVPSTTVTASGSSGTIAVDRYPANPGPAPTFASTGTYFNVNIAPGGTFTEVLVTKCGQTEGSSLYWLNGATWVPVIPQVFQGGCLRADLDTVRSFPLVSQLGSTVFAVAGGASAAATSAAPPAVTGVSPATGGPGTQVTLAGSGFTGAHAVYFGGVPGTGLAVASDGQLTVTSPHGIAGTVDVTVVSAAGRSPPVAADQFTVTGVPVAAVLTAGGGTLGSPDGAFVMVVPPGALAAPLTLAESTAAPTGLPAGFVAASPTFTLAGAAPATPEQAVIRFQPSALDGGSPARLAVYARTPSGAWSYMPTLVGSAAVSVAVSQPETLAVLAGTTRFSDLPAGFWARPAIDALLAAGVVGGFPDGTFRPDAALSRAEFVKMLDLATGLQPGTGTGGFADVQAGDWFAPYVAAAAQAGLVQGLTPTTFGPSATVTREQMAVLLDRALRLTGTQALTFSDAGQVDPYALQAVQAAVAAGYLSGFPDGTFQPRAATTRAQAAKVLARVLASRAPRH